MFNPRGWQTTWKMSMLDMICFDKDMWTGFQNTAILSGNFWCLLHFFNLRENPSDFQTGGIKSYSKQRGTLSLIIFKIEHTLCIQSLQGHKIDSINTIATIVKIMWLEKRKTFFLLILKLTMLFFFFFNPK